MANISNNVSSLQQQTFDSSKTLYLGEDEIGVSFCWSADTKGITGKVWVGVVDLIFQDTKEKFSVDISENLNSEKYYFRPFRFTNYGDHGQSLGEEECQRLSMTIERINNLTIKVGCFEDSPVRRPMLMNSAGQILGREKRLLRSDSKIDLEINEDIELGELYTILITGEMHDFKAQLIKEAYFTSEEPALSEATQAMAGYISKTLCDFIKGFLVGIKQAEIRLGKFRNLNPLKISIPTDVKGVEELVSLASAIILSEIAKLDSEMLEKTMAKVQAIENETEGKSELVTEPEKKPGFKLCIEAIGPEALKNIMVTLLKSIIVKDSFTEKMPELTEKSIVKAAESFPEIILKVCNEIEEEEKESAEASSSTSSSTVESKKSSNDINELTKLLGGVLLPLMGLKLAEFGLKAKVNLNEDLESPFKIGIDIIEKEIKKLDQKTIESLAKNLRTQKAEWQVKTQPQKDALEKELFKKCFDAITEKGLKNIMASNIKSFIKGTVSKETEDTIDSISERFKEICINQVNKKD